MALIPCLRPGLEVSAGLLYLQPGSDNLGWGTITTFLPLPNPQWQVQTLTPEYQPGFQVGLRYAFQQPGVDVQANWEHLRTSSNDAVAVTDPTAQWISPFMQTGPPNPNDPATIGVFDFKSAAAAVDYDYDMINLDFGQSVNLGASMQARIFAGASYANLRERLCSTFYTAPNAMTPDPLVDYISIDNTSTFSGAGPRLGVQAMYGMCGGVNLVGNFAGALLVGQMQPAQFLFSGVYNPGGGQLVNREGIYSEAVAQVVSAFDGRLGLNYLYVFAGGAALNVEVGFKAAIFIQPFSTYQTSTNVLPLESGSLSTNSMRHTWSNFTLNGLYLNAGLNW